MDLVPHKKQSLTRAQFEQLADVPPELARDIYYGRRGRINVTLALG